jgi:hypothetical protein
VNHECHGFLLIAQMIKVENDYVIFPTINTWMIFKVLTNQDSVSLPVARSLSTDVLLMNILIL